MTAKGLYACLYWIDNGDNVMRGCLSDLLPHVQRINDKGLPWKVETFDYTVEAET